MIEASERIGAGMSYSFGWNEKQKCFIARVQRPDKTWKTKFLPRKIVNENEAEAWLARWYGAFLEAAPVAAIDVATAKVSIAMLAESWRKRKGSDPVVNIKTFRNYEQSLRNYILTAPIAKLDLQTLTTSDLRDWIDNLNCKSNAYKLAHITAFSSIFNDCIRLGLLSENLASPFDRPIIRDCIKNIHNEAQKEQDIVTVLSDKSVDSYCKAETDCDFRKLRTFITLATGLRIGELEGLTWQHVVLDAKIPYVVVEHQLIKTGSAPYSHWRTIGKSKDEVSKLECAVVHDPKGSRSKIKKRAIPLHPLAVEALRYWWKKGWCADVGREPTADDPVFAANKNCKNPGNFWQETDASGLLRRDLLEAKLPTKSSGRNLTWHALRHTFATMLNDCGCEEAKVSTLLGHTGSMTSESYIKKNLPPLYEAVCKLPLTALSLRKATLAITANGAANVVSELLGATELSKLIA